MLSPSHLAVCVASLQDIKLFNNNLDVVDDAFEYLMSKAQKGEKGQYFTPRYVIRTLHMCYPGDVVLTKGGRVGTAGLITQPSYVTRDLIFINASALSRKDYIVLYLFFSSSFAYKQMVRSSSMTAQPHLTITLIRDLLVCNYSNSFKDKVEKYFTTLEKLNHQAQILYSEAKQILIKELKVCTEGITSDSYTTKYLSTSFKVSGRLDAEYYQPKYDGYLSALEQFETTKIPNEFDVLKNSGTNYAEGVSDVGVIKTKQLTNSGVNTDGIESYFTHETCIENKSTLVVNNDVVFASMGVGSLGKVSLFSYDGDKPFVTDSTLRIYRAKKHTHVLPEVLCIFLQSAIGQELIYRYVVGSTGIINIYDDDIAKIPIPILDGEIQKDIAEKVQNSFALRRQSKQLLEYAKQPVEMAIEQGEDAALVWLKERSGE